MFLKLYNSDDACVSMIMMLHTLRTKRFLRLKYKLSDKATNKSLRGINLYDGYICCLSYYLVYYK